MADTQEEALIRAREEFVGQWGVLGSTWGINRTMAQLHALLLVSVEPLSTDDVMKELSISRGNANSNLRELVDWGLVYSVFKKGERKEYFEAEKDVWTIFCTVSRERKRRETEPALRILERCGDMTKDLSSEEGRHFHEQISQLAEFVDLANSFMDKVAESEQGKIMPFLLKLFKKD